MTDFESRKDRSEEHASQGIQQNSRGRNPQEGESAGIERGTRGLQRQNSYPSIFSVSPGEFFTMSPITLMRRFTEDIDRAFGGYGGNLQRDSETEEAVTWMPRVEVRQSGSNLIIQAELPGLNENDVKLEASEEGLVIEGERRREHTVDQGGMHHTERSYGRFYRLIPLPESAKIEETKANLRNGVLEVTVPVPELERKRRQIPISTSGQETTSAATTETRTKAAGSSR